MPDAGDYDPDTIRSELASLAEARNDARRCGDMAEAARLTWRIDERLDRLHGILGTFAHDEYDDLWRCKVCRRWWVVPGLARDCEARHEAGGNGSARVESEHRKTPATGATARGHGQPEEAG